MLRMLSLSAAVMVALLSTGCVSTSKTDTPASSAVVNTETAKPQTVFAARLQPVAGVTTVELADNRIKVSFPGITAFSHDGASISDELQRQLNAVVEALKGTTYQTVTVLGHTTVPASWLTTTNCRSSGPNRLWLFYSNRGWQPSN